MPAVPPTANATPAAAAACELIVGAIERRHTVMAPEAVLSVATPRHVRLFARPLDRVLRNRCGDADGHAPAVPPMPPTIEAASTCDEIGGPLLLAVTVRPPAVKRLRRFAVDVGLGVDIDRIG